VLRCEDSPVTLVQAFTAALSKYHQESEKFRQQIERIYQQQANACVSIFAAPPLYC
jgi:hypothetical protein